MEGPSRARPSLVADLFRSLKRRLTVEKVCFYLIIGLVLFCACCVPSYLAILDDYRKTGFRFQPGFYLLAPLGFLLSRALFLLSTQVLAPALKPYTKEEPLKSATPGVPQLTEAENLKKLGNYIYGSLYYVSSVAALLRIAVRDRLLPTQLFGTLDPDSFCGTWPETFSADLNVYYMLSLGHHMERTYYEFRDNRAAPTFYTMVYHHLLTVALISTSFLGDLQKWGIFILLTHDFCDIILNTGRVSKVTLPSAVTNLFNVALLASWGYLRLWVFTRVVFVSIARCYLDPASPFRRHPLALALFLPTLGTLACLNAFWWFQIVKIGYSRIFKKDYQLIYLEKRDSERDGKRD